MNSLPPSLLYFVIYNPTLKPSQPLGEDDEDAEEQAHVLFYTAKEHAVSRDRVLRQVGLAKAVVNFTSMFDARSSCDSVHSLNRRMVTICPESSYWIHACVELARTQRIPKKIDKGKGKGKQTDPVYEYDESSLHDSALRTQLSQGYERFKLLHGTFASILHSEGRDSLELQLERYFTVWAWSWDLSKQIPFADYLGTRIHPFSNQLTLYIETLALPKGYEPVVLVANCVVLKKDSTPIYPPALLPYLLSLLNRPVSQPRQVDSRLSEGDEKDTDIREKPPQSSQENNREIGNTTRFLGAPQFNMSAMDVRKWSWPNYLTFGARKTSTADLRAVDAAAGTTGVSSAENGPEEGARNEDSVVPASEKAASDDEKQSLTHVRRASNFDSIALEEALSSDGATVSSLTDTRPPSPSPSASDAQSAPDLQSVDSSSSEHNDELMSETVVLERKEGPAPLEVETKVDTATVAHPGDNHAISAEDTTRKAHAELETSIPVSRLAFSYVRVNIPCADEEIPKRRRIPYIKREGSMLALVPLPSCANEIDLESEEMLDLATSIDGALALINTAIIEEQETISAATSSAPVQDVFQKSQHAITIPRELVHSSNSFSCSSWQLHEGKHILSAEPEVLEVFSRGQNPQDWHLVKRGRDESEPGDVYMEIARKEASLTDVDYELSALIRRFTE